MTDEIIAAARALLDANRYAVLATASAAGEPWASPVYFVSRGFGTVLWLSRPSSRHSVLLAENPRIAVTVFDSTVGMGGATAFYGQGSAALCPEDELDAELAVFSARSADTGFPTWRPEQVTGDAALRLYRAELAQAWLLPVEDGPERRVPLPVEDSRAAR
jgi:hypothetical protein